jgi:hypothetical protein
MREIVSKATLTSTSIPRSPPAPAAFSEPKRSIVAAAVNVRATRAYSSLDRQHLPSLSDAVRAVAIRAPRARQTEPIRLTRDLVKGAPVDEAIP